VWLALPPSLLWEKHFVALCIAIAATALATYNAARIAEMSFLKSKTDLVDNN
jgi:hypothetical protein